MGSYDKAYLNSTIKIHEYLLHQFVSSGYSFFDLLDKYLLSEVRRQIDDGNPLALNLTPHQLLSRIPLNGIKKSDNTNIDPFITNWMANILVYIQWYYEISSKEIAKKIDLKKLYGLYYPLHETALVIGADKVYAMFWRDNES